MGSTLQPNFQLLYNDARLVALFEALDELHGAVSEGELQKITTLSNAEMIAWLHDLIYTAQETIEEIKTQADAPVELRLVRKTS